MKDSASIGSTSTNNLVRISPCSADISVNIMMTWSTIPLSVLHGDDSLKATSTTSSSPLCVLSNGYTRHSWEAQVDLVIAVGGDGTVLSASHFLGDNIPLVGVNSDPTRAEEKSSTKRTDERRSFGALCLCTALDVERELPKVRCRCRSSRSVSACSSP